MANELEIGLIPAQEQRLLAELDACNARSARFGLTLSKRAMAELAEKRQQALLDHGRVELGESAVTAIIDGFCDSPFLLQEEYETTLLELVDAFYGFKNACGDQLADEELIAAMRERYDAFDGAVDAVLGTTLEALCRARRLGQEDEEWQEEELDDE